VKGKKAEVLDQKGCLACHHRTPLGELTCATFTTLDDLAIVCANCHRILHRPEARGMKVEELRERLLRREAAGKINLFRRSMIPEE
jgi:predicted HNH restriction endonuclease